MIAIIDYGVGNLFSLKCSFESIGADICVTSDPEVIAKADRIILPGVGAFEDAAKKLRDSGLDKVIKKDPIKIQQQQSKKKKYHYRTQKIDPSLIKTISFEKTSGRDNKLKERRKQLDKFIGYSPNYDFIRKDTTKTCT